MQGIFHTWILISIYFHHCILCEESCNNTRSVLSVEQGDVILHLNKSGIKDVSWVQGGRHIATSKPKKPIDIKTLKFKFRLHGMPDGSLKITNISRKDRGTYSANIFMRNNTEFVQCYSLDVQRKLTKDDIQILPNVHQIDSCSMSLTCKVNQTDVTVSWTNDISEELPATNATLSLNDTEPNVTLICTAENLASKASVVVRPWIYCREQGHRQETILPLITMSIPLVVIACCGCLLYRKQKKDTHEETSGITTVCSQVEPSPEESSVSFYSVITQHKTLCD